MHLPELGPELCEMPIGELQRPHPLMLRLERPFLRFPRRRWRSPWPRWRQEPQWTLRSFRLPLLHYDQLHALFLRSLSLPLPLVDNDREGTEMSLGGFSGSARWAGDC